MKVAVFSRKYYEREYLNNANAGGKHQLTFYDTILNEDSINLTIGYEAVCILLSDKIDQSVVERLMSFNNVLITPHQAFFTKEAVEQMALTTIKNFTDFENGIPSVNEVKIEKTKLLAPPV